MLSIRVNFTIEMSEICTENKNFSYTISSRYAVFIKNTRTDIFIFLEF